MVQRILLVGGSGLIGSYLKKILEGDGREVKVIGRSAQSDYQWSPARKEYPSEAFEWAQGVINLAGAGIADKRWTNSRKKVLRDSRVDSVKTISAALNESTSNVKVWVNASAVGFYGNDSSSKWYDLNDKVGETYLAKLTADWEQAMANVQGVRQSILRIGVVLTNKGGALPELNKFPILTTLGTGEQWMPWIHIDDVSRMLVHMLDHSDIQGPMNGVAPSVARHKELVKQMSKSFHKWSFAWVPGWILRLVLGEMADVVLHGTRVSNSAWQPTSFEYHFSTLEEALDDLAKNDER